MTDLVIPGLEAVLTYNGSFVMNDLTQPERYRITQMTGHDDADVRDVRGSLAGRDGEYSLPYLRGGRTLVYTGYIEALNFRRLRVMTMAMKTAFATRSEQATFYTTPAFEYNVLL